VNFGTIKGIIASVPFAGTEMSQVARKVGFRAWRRWKVVGRSTGGSDLSSLVALRCFEGSDCRWRSTWHTRRRESRVFEGGGPIDLVQAGLVGLNHVTGGPWWSTFMIGTISFRLLLVPVTVWQIKSVRNLMTGPAAVHLRQLSMLYAKEVEKTPQKRFGLTRIYLRGVGAVFRKFKVNPVKFVAVPLTQIAALVTFIVATRRLISDGALDLTDQGMLWFNNLGARDSTMILPLLAVGLSYSSLERNLGRTVQHEGEAPKITFGDGFREVLQTFLVFGFPFIAQLPSGIFMYWIPSAMFGNVQSRALKSQRIRDALDLGPIPKKIVFKKKKKD